VDNPLRSKEESVTENLFQIVKQFSETIHNGRSISDIIRHAKDEMRELDDEVLAVKYPTEFTPGKDGVVGEAIDVIACMLDLIVVHSPTTTEHELNAMMLLKCEKWARRYKDSVDGDRTID